MDYNFDIVVSENDLCNFGFKEKKLFWEEKELSYTPKEFLIDDNINFIMLTVGKIHDILLEETAIYSPIMLTLNIKYNSVVEIIENNHIPTLLNNTYKINHFSFYLWGDDELINQEYKLIGNMNISTIMKNAIRNKQNIRIYR